MLIIHADIAIHLSNILMRQFPQLEINQQKAFEFEVVEHQINVKVLILGANALLPCDKGKAFT